MEEARMLTCGARNISRQLLRRGVNLWPVIGQGLSTSWEWVWIQVKISIK
jgi:hypothetical protein